MKDIENLDDIKVFVDNFYSKVQQNDLLAPIFATRIDSNDWERHLNRMYSFWNTVLFNQRGYKGNAFAKHAELPVEPQHFSTWTTLFKETIDQDFAGDRAEEVKNRVDKMALLFMSKIQHLRDNSNYKSLV